MGTVSEAEVTLFTVKVSPFAQRVRIVLEEKSIPYKVINVNTFDKPQLLVESNPIYKKVPTIVHNGKPVAESLVILEYLEDEWPLQAPLMPKDSFEKSKVRFWTDFICKAFEKISETRKFAAGSPEQQAAHEEAIKNLKTLEAAMASYSTEGPFFTGKTFGYLDVVLAHLENTLWVAEKFGGFVVPGPDEIARLQKWMDAVKARPSFRAVMPAKEEFLPYLTLPPKERREWFAASAK